MSAIRFLPREKPPSGCLLSTLCLSSRQGRIMFPFFLLIFLSVMCMSNEHLCVYHSPVRPLLCGLYSVCLCLLNSASGAKVFQSKPSSAGPRYHTILHWWHCAILHLWFDHSVSYLHRKITKQTNKQNEKTTLLRKNSTRCSSNQANETGWHWDWCIVSLCSTCSTLKPKPHDFSQSPLRVWLCS